MKTPTSLITAILNGMRAADMKNITVEQLACIRLHVRDFLSQKFCGFFLHGDQTLEVLKTLWKEITGKK
jgi:hypothetical protein